MLAQHAMLVITRTVFDIVQIPGQQPLVVARDTGDEAARQWWDDHIRAAAVFSQGNESWNQQLADWQAAYYGANYARLESIRKSVDPHHFFNFPQAIGR